MKFLENLKKAAEKTANTVVKKTGEIVEDSKTKYSIFDLNNDIEKVYTEIGKEIYAGYKEAIDKLNAEIEELKRKLED